MTWPRPTPAQLTKLYDEQYYDDHGMGSTAGAHWRERAAEILRFVSTPVATALDCGAGQGHFVSALSSLGVSSTGFEPSRAAREQARRQHQIELLAELPERGGWDLISLVHSLEHMPDPLACLRSASGLLGPGGRIYIEVPHAGSIEMWRPRWRRQILTLPAHLYHFTPDSLQKLVSQAGLEVLRVRVADAELLAWIYAQWTRWRRRPEPPPADPAPEAQSVEQTRPAPRSSARQQLVARATRLLPGWKFQIVARVRADAISAAAGAV